LFDHTTRQEDRTKRKQVEKGRTFPREAGGRGCLTKNRRKITNNGLQTNPQFDDRGITFPLKAESNQKKAWRRTDGWWQVIDSGGYRENGGKKRKTSMIATNALKQENRNGHLPANERKAWFQILKKNQHRGKGQKSSQHRKVGSFSRRGWARRQGEGCRGLKANVYGVCPEWHTQRNPKYRKKGGSLRGNDAIESSGHQGGGKGPAASKGKKRFPVPLEISAQLQHDADHFDILL